MNNNQKLILLGLALWWFWNKQKPREDVHSTIVYEGTTNVDPIDDNLNLQMADFL